MIKSRFYSSSIGLAENKSCLYTQNSLLANPISFEILREGERVKLGGGLLAVREEIQVNF